MNAKVRVIYTEKYCFFLCVSIPGRLTYRLLSFVFSFRNWWRSKQSITTFIRMLWWATTAQQATMGQLLLIKGLVSLLGRRQSHTLSFSARHIRQLRTAQSMCFTFGLNRGFKTRLNGTASLDPACATVSVKQWIRVVAQERGQFGNPDERERPPLEAATKQRQWRRDFGNWCACLCETTSFIRCA
jgi:hypothetical protein